MATKPKKLAVLIEFLKKFRDEKSWQIGKCMTADDGSEATCFISFEKGDSVWVSYDGGVCSLIPPPEHQNMRPIDYVKSPFREVRKLFAIENYFYPKTIAIDEELVMECLQSKDENMIMFGLKWLDEVDIEDAAKREIINAAISSGKVEIKYEYFMSHKDFKKIPWRQEYKKIAMKFDILSAVNHNDFVLTDEELEGFALDSKAYSLSPFRIGYRYIKNLKITHLNKEKIENLVFRSGHNLQIALLENKTYRPSEEILDVILVSSALCETMLLRMDLDISPEKISSALDMHKEINSIWEAAVQRADFLPTENEERHGRSFTHKVSWMFEKRADEWASRREKNKLMVDAGMSDGINRKVKKSI
jgi:hypothetical protein